MTQLVIALCALACPASMVLMMVFMRKGHRRGSQETGQHSASTESVPSVPPQADAEAHRPRQRTDVAWRLG